MIPDQKQNEICISRNPKQKDDAFRLHSIQAIEKPVAKQYDLK